MTPTHPWMMLSLGVLMIMTASCAVSRPVSAVAPPRLMLPPEAEARCGLARLPSQATAADLEAAYVRRGAQIAACDAARQLAVDTLRDERALIDVWMECVGWQKMPANSVKNAAHRC